MIEFSLETLNKKSPYKIFAEPGRFTICAANTIIEGHGFYAAIIVENRNPKLKAITEEFETIAQALTSDKP